MKNLNVGPYLPPWTPSDPGPADSPRSSNTSVWYVGYKSSGAPYLLAPKAVSFADAAKGKF